MEQPPGWELGLGLALGAIAVWLAACAWQAWTRRSRALACFAAWAITMAACVVAAGASALPKWMAGIGPTAWLLHSVASTELLLAFFEDDLNSAKLRRGIRLAPLAGIALAVAAALAAPVLRFDSLPYVSAFAFVAVLVSAFALRDAGTRLVALGVYLGGWGLHAAAAAGSALATAGAASGFPWFSPAAGAAAFALCTLAVLLHTLHGDERRRERAQRNLLDSARKYRHVYYSAPVALVSVDTLGQVLRWNDLASRYFRNELRQGRVNTIAALFGIDRAAVLLREATATGRYRSELSVSVDGEPAGARLCAVDALLAGNAIEISLVDVTERIQCAQTLEHMAYHDALTDRLNLHGLEREIEQAARRVSAGADASMLCIELHRFKAINDVYGHAAGNAVVVGVSKRLDSVLPEATCVARLGGDEFIVLLPDCALERARDIAQRVVACVVDDAYEVDGKRIRVDASIGVVEVAPEMGAGELIAYANAACGEARRSRDGGIVAAQSSGEHLARYRAEAELGLRLRTSLPTERIRVFAQPIVSLRAAGAEQAMPAYEILLRERDERGEILPPARLIAAAERHGAMRAVDWYMLERTIEHLGSNRHHAASLDFVTVNLSGISLNDERFLADAHSLLLGCGDIADKLCLEITESVAMFDIDSTRRFVERMRSLGVRIALDDFGAGYSSFAYLRELPASMIKIDGQFMLGIDRNPRNQVIVRGIRRLGEELGLKCVAEWVEDVEALEFLLRVGMDYAQGFVLARPLPIERWLVERADTSALDEARRRLLALDAAGRAGAEARRRAAAGVVSASGALAARAAAQPVSP